jgi:hypothetical protein
VSRSFAWVCRGGELFLVRNDAGKVRVSSPQHSTCQVPTRFGATPRDVESVPDRRYVIMFVS